MRASSIIIAFPMPRPLSSGRTNRSSRSTPGFPSQVEDVKNQSANPATSPSCSARRTEKRGDGPNPCRRKSSSVATTASGARSYSARSRTRRRMTGTSAGVAVRSRGTHSSLPHGGRAVRRPPELARAALRLTGPDARAPPHPQLQRPLLRTLAARPRLDAHGETLHRARDRFARAPAAHPLPAGGGDLLPAVDARLPPGQARGDAARVVHGRAGARLRRAGPSVSVRGLLLPRAREPHRLPRSLHHGPGDGGGYDPAARRAP